MAPPSSSSVPEVHDGDGDTTLTALLRWACVACLLGRAWQHLMWDAPLRALLWSQSRMEGMVQAVLGMDWNTYATNPTVATGISGIVRGMGAFYLLAAVAAALCTRERRWAQAGVLLAVPALAFLTYLTFLDKMQRLGELAELGCQVLIPVLLLLAVRRAPPRQAILTLGAVAVAATFFGHALYAHGPYPLPGPWVDMTMAATGLGERGAVWFLRLAGTLDYLVALAVFFPRVRRWAFAYAAIWGLLTALARPVAHFRPVAPWAWIDPWLFECLVRAPNFLLPLALAWMLWTERRPVAQANKQESNEISLPSPLSP